ncbi:MAG TPA: MerC domain-containing protein [Allosphingosinicella sp.]|jgi:hypothetical protein
MIDRLAIGLSGLCLVHCIASAVFVAFLAAGGSFLLDPIFHEVGMSIALVLGVVGLGRGILNHGYMMPASVGGLGLGVMAGSLVIGHENGGTLYSIIGVLIVALGHDLNRRAII